MSCGHRVAPSQWAKSPSCISLDAVQIDAAYASVRDGFRFRTKTEPAGYQQKVSSSNQFIQRIENAAMQFVPITEHERRYLTLAQVLCVPMPNGIPRLLFQRTDGMSADFCRPGRPAKTTKDGRSVTSLLSVTPAGVPVGRRAVSRRPGE